MNRNNMRIADFRLVLLLAQHGSLRAVSEDVGLSTSAISRHLSMLEELLSARLFDRDTRNLSLTASGETFVKLAERMLNTAEDVMSEFNAHLSARRGTLTIAGLPSITAGVLPKLLRGFAAQFPEIDLRIIDALSAAVLDAVESGNADIGFTAGAISDRRRLAFQPLLDDEFVAVGAVEGPLAQDRVYEWEEVMTMPFIAMAKGTSVRDLTDAACQRHGYILTPRFEVSHLATAGAFVTEGLGVTVLPQLTLAVLKMDRLVQRKLKGMGERRHIGLVRRAGSSPSPNVAAFLNYLRQHGFGHVATHQR
ncbi:LysR family transcriptional regulator [Pseudorhizobium marinum]|uniref:LysR family transcriptional regulator n=1 Tax=Pseudorhizobium marinum TaxID=1496690 RepID=UPI0009DE9B71|nr:LysR family transcriptional regulator [Pseudorhizobium marinum]